jgi:hypothetical protein
MANSTLVRRARRATVAACAAALAIGVAACGGDSGSSDANPAEAVPASAPLYISATVRPEGELKTNTENALKKILKTDDPSAEVEKWLTEAFDEEDISYKDDIEPWVGEQAGIFFTSFSGDDADGAAVIASADNDKAKEFVDKVTADGGQDKTYNDVDYRLDDGTAAGVVGDYVVTGTERGFRTVVDTVNGDGVETMTDNDDYNKALSVIGEGDALGTIYVSTTRFIDALARSGGIPADQLAGVRQALATTGGTASVAKLGVTGNAISLDAATLGMKPGEGDPGNAAAAVAALPGDAWLGLGIPTIGQSLRTALQQVTQVGAVGGTDVKAQLDAVQQQLGINLEQDLFSWMGDGGLFVRGTSIADIGGALVVQSSDPARTKEALDKIGNLIPQLSPTTKVQPLRGVQGADGGIAITPSDFPFPIMLATAGDKFVAGINQAAIEAAISGQSKLSDNEAFKTASSALDGVEPMFFFDIGSVMTLAEGLGAGDDPDFAEAQSYIEQFGSVAAGTQRDGDTQRSKLVITMK